MASVSKAEGFHNEIMEVSVIEPLKKGRVSYVRKSHRPTYSFGAESHFGQDDTLAGTHHLERLE